MTDQDACWEKDACVGMSEHDIRHFPQRTNIDNHVCALEGDIGVLPRGAQVGGWMSSGKWCFFF